MCIFVQVWANTPRQCLSTATLTMMWRSVDKTADGEWPVGHKSDWSKASKVVPGFTALERL